MSSSTCGPPARTKEVAVQILIVNFNLDGLSEEEFASACDELAPAFAAVPGLASKVWLANRAEGVFGGVYPFESEKAVDDFLQSDLFAGVGSTPGLVNISVRRFGVLDGPTRVTRGLSQPGGRLNWHCCRNERQRHAEGTGARARVPSARPRRERAACGVRLR